MVTRVGEDGVSLRPRRRDRRNADRGVPRPHVPVRGAWRVGCDPDGPRRAVLPACADRQRHWPRRVLHGRRLDDAGSGAPGAADAAQPSGARGAEPLHWRAAPAGGRRRPPPPGQFPRRAAVGTSIGITTSATSSSASFSTPSCSMYSCGYFDISRRFARAGASPEGRSHLPGAETRTHRPRARDWQRVGRLRRLGGDPLWLPRDDHDDQRRTVPPRLRLAVAASARRGRASRCCARTTAN